MPMNKALADGCTTAKPYTKALHGDAQNECHPPELLMFPLICRSGPSWITPRKIRRCNSSLPLVGQVGVAIQRGLARSTSTGCVLHCSSLSRAIHVDRQPAMQTATHEARLRHLCRARWVSCSNSHQCAIQQLSESQCYCCTRTACPHTKAPVPSARTIPASAASCGPREANPAQPCQAACIAPAYCHRGTSAS